MCVKPIRSRIEAIQQLKPPTNVKGCRSFAEMVNFVSIFCPELQKLLKPIYELTKEGRHFIWGKEQEEAFDEIKARLQKPPVLSMPDKRGIFTLYSDMSKHATGSVLYQVKDGSPKLIVIIIGWDSSVGRAAGLHVRGPGFNTHSQLNLARVESAFHPFVGR